MDPNGPQQVPSVLVHGEVPTAQIVIAFFAAAATIAGLISAFFAIPFYGLRERFRRDHFTDLGLAESYVEDAQVVPSLVAIYEHVKRQMEEHPGQRAQTFLLDVASRDLIDTLLEHVVDYENLGDLYRVAILYGDLVWKFALAAVVMVLLFPMLRFVWIIPSNHWGMTVYWSVGTVIVSGLLFVFIFYTRVRDRLMGLLERYGGPHD